MATFNFEVQWVADISVEAIDEDEAFELIYAGTIIDHFGKGKGELTVELSTTPLERSEWGLFDTDPEDPDITHLGINDAEYL
jgi:hypothetical protein